MMQQKPQAGQGQQNVASMFATNKPQTPGGAAGAYEFKAPGTGMGSLFGGQQGQQQQKPLFGGQQQQQQQGAGDKQNLFSPPPQLQQQQQTENKPGTPTSGFLGQGTGLGGAGAGGAFSGAGAGQGATLGQNPFGSRPGTPSLMNPNAGAKPQGNLFNLGGAGGATQNASPLFGGGNTAGRL